MNDTLTVVSVPRSWAGVPRPSNAATARKPARTPRGAGMGSWASAVATAATPPPSGRRHTPINAVPADKAAVMRSTGRLTYSAGWSSKKAIAFDAAI